MSNLDSFYSNWRPRVLSLLRVVAAFCFMLHGAQKLFGFLASAQWNRPPMLSLIGIAGILEFFGGLLLLVGLFTRPVAFILSGLMAVAYFRSHAPQGFWPLQNRGELAAVYCFVFLYFTFAGAGAWSIDRLLSRGRSSSELDAVGTPPRKVA